MNHILLFNHIQTGDTYDQKYTYTLKSLIKTLNNETDLHKMRREMLIALKFIELKMTDEKKLGESLTSDQVNQFLLANDLVDEVIDNE